MPVLTAVATDEEGPVESPVVIVGAGTAGIAFAIEFCRHSRAPLVMIEQGGDAVGSSSPGFLDAVRPENMWPGLRVQCVDNGPVTPYMQARVIGGGSAVNGMLEGTDQAPAQRRFLADLLGNPAPSDTVGDALAALNGRRWRRNTSDGRRVDGTSALAEMTESGRVVLVRGEVDHVIIRHGRAVGVVVGGREIAASRVVMCAGAVGTPLVLSRSDLPPDLARMVGDTLFDHPSITFTLHRRTPARPGAPDVSTYVEVADLPWRETEAAAAPAAAANPALARAALFEELWRTGATLPVARRGLITGYERASRDAPGLGLLSGVLLDPVSRGRLELDGAPLLRPRMLSHPYDAAAMVAIVRDMIRVSLRPEIAAVATHVTVDTAGTRVTEIAGLPDDLLLEWIRSHLVPLSHAAGTCASLLGNDLLTSPPTDGSDLPAGLTASRAQHMLAQRRIAARWREINRAESVASGRISDPRGWMPRRGSHAVKGIAGLHVADSSGLAVLPHDMVNAHVARRAVEVASAIALGAGRPGEQGRTA